MSGPLTVDGLFSALHTAALLDCEWNRLTHTRPASRDECKDDRDG